MSYRVVFEPERGQRVPVRVWARAPAVETLRQLQHIASQPYVVEHVAAMADAHVSEGVAVGTVFATERTVVPAARGAAVAAACSHGAGRVLTRREARTRNFPDALARAMRRVVFPSGHAPDFVEEAPAAYRDIGEVLEDQEDLVRRSVRLEPIAVLKG